MQWEHFHPALNAALNLTCFGFLIAGRIAINRKDINQVIFFGLAKESGNTALPESPLYDEANARMWMQSDKALAGFVQEVNAVPYMPITPGIGRLRMSWPEGQQVKVSAGPRFALPEPTTRSGYRQVEVVVPRSKPEEMPGDAPPRYHGPTLLQMTSFAEWAQVSQTMAPLYDTSTAIVPEGPIAAEVARIAAASSDPKTRAAAARNLVQDPIPDIAKGHDRGHYFPQTAGDNWELR